MTQGKNGGTLTKAGIGRTPGKPNKLTSEVKAVISNCFEKIGGIEEFAAWAKDNRTEFYKIYSRMIPQADKGMDDKGGIVVQIVQFGNREPNIKEINNADS